MTQAIDREIQAQPGNPLGLDGIGHMTPALDLRLGVDPRGVLIALALLRDL